MEECCVHHIEFGVRNGDEYVRKFIQHYKFALAAKRYTNLLKQWLLKSGTATVLLTQQCSTDGTSYNDKYCVGWAAEDQNDGTTGYHSDVDSVYNVALKVKDLAKVLEKLSRSDVRVLKPAARYTDDHGSVNLAVVKSCLGNVIHTLIDDSKYNGVFLPDFIVENDYCGTRSGELVSHFDHVTFACECGDSGRVLDWYSQHFGMRRFLINR